MSRRLWVSLALGFVCRAALAYDAQPTHIGLTERAAYASNLHRVLIEDWGRPLGLFEPLASSLPAAFKERLSLLGPHEGVRPDESGRTSALGWLLAGAAVEELSVTRSRNHFFDPRSGQGLTEFPGPSRLLFALFGTHELGQPLELPGVATPDWAISPKNDLGLSTWLDAVERSGLAATKLERDAASVNALLALGALAHLLEDMGSPSHVRNDLRGELEVIPGSSLWDQRSGYERFVARQYGRLGIPGPIGPNLQPKHLRDLFVELARYVATHFFSPGTLPKEVALRSGLSAQQMSALIDRALPYPEPRALVIDTTRPEGLVRSSDGAVLARHEIRGSRLRLFLDAETHAAYAQLLLPRVVHDTAALIGFLLRGALSFEKQGNDWVVRNRGPALARGRLRLLVENDQGRRQLALPAIVLGPKNTGDELARVPLSERSSRMIAVFRGQDSQGEELVVIEDIATPSP